LVVVSDTVALGNNCVWPGDANNDKVADNLDIFPIGLLNGVVGPIRANASLIWNDQPANIWGTNIPGTLIDAQHADCNGDGVVDGNDTVAILQNYGNTHLRQKGGAGNLVTLTVGPDTLYQNTTATILVGLGTASLPADSIYGVAFSFNVDPTAIDTNSINVSIPPSWLFANSTDHFNIFKLDKSATKVHVGLVRNNQVAKSGFGNFITITIDITSGNIVGRETDLFNRKYKLKCSIDNISILKLDGTIVNPITVEDSASTVFYNSNIGINAVNKIPLSASIYPNPTTNKSVLMIKGAEQNEAKNVLIVDVFGKVISEKIIATNQTEIDLSALQSGLYLVKIITKNGISESKIIKQ
jgi:hypothetical protein